VRGMFDKFGFVINDYRCCLFHPDMYRPLHVECSWSFLAKHSTDAEIVQRLRAHGVWGIVGVHVPLTSRGQTYRYLILNFASHEEAWEAHIKLEQIMDTDSPFLDVSWSSTIPKIWKATNVEDLRTMLLLSDTSTKVQDAKTHLYTTTDASKKTQKIDLFKKQHADIHEALIATNYDLKLTAKNLQLNQKYLLTFIQDLTRLGYDFNFPPSFKSYLEPVLGDAAELEQDLINYEAEKQVQTEAELKLEMEKVFGKTGKSKN